MCGQGWFQHDWQDSDRVSREQVAQAIHQAEKMIRDTVGYNLLPDWSDQVVEFPRSGRPEESSLYDSRSRMKGLLVKPHFISGGVRRADSLEASAPIVFSDLDGDGFSEVGIVTVPSGDLVDPYEVRAFFSGTSADPTWEIRPIQTRLESGNFILTIPSYLLLDPTWAEEFDPEVRDGDDPSTFVTTLDVYRVWNNPASQVDLIWEPSLGDCSSTPCEGVYQTGCLHTRDSRLGIVSFAPSTWDEASETFLSSLLVRATPPDRLRVRYYSGFEAPGSVRSRIAMDPYWEYTLVALSCTLLDRPVCDCTNVESYFDRWTDDLARVSDDKSFLVSPGDLLCPFGTYRGSIYAWRRCHEEGRRIVR